MMNEWSKYSFKKECRDIVLAKAKPICLSYIQKRRGKLLVIRNKKSYGTYEDINDAIIVRDFLIKENWNEKYIISNLCKEIDECNHLNASDYQLKIAKGEYGLDG